MKIVIEGEKSEILEFLTSLVTPQVLIASDPAKAKNSPKAKALAASKRLLDRLKSPIPTSESSDRDSGCP
jgi:hypothetical protein